MMKKDIKIGDEVRFLNDVGGGKVTAIRANGVIEVQDQTGFNIPVRDTDVVVVTPGSTIVPKPEVHLKSQSRPENSPQSVSPAPQSVPSPVPNRKRSDDKAYDELNLWIAYLPEDPDQLGHSPYEVYVVNDSNYDLYVQLLCHDDEGGARVVYSNTVAFDSSVFAYAFPPDEVSKNTIGTLRALPFKQGEAFELKPAYDVQLKVGAAKFFKRNAFVPNDFFDDDAIIVPIIEHDRGARPGNVDVQKLSQVMQEKKHADQQPSRQRKPRSKETQGPLVIDLHIDELIDTTAGMEAKDILELQLDKVREVMKAHEHDKGKQIVFIHGKGEGVLRKEVAHLLRREFPKALLQDASFQEYGFGATQVTVY